MKKERQMVVKKDGSVWDKEFGKVGYMRGEHLAVTAPISVIESLSKLKNTIMVFVLEREEKNNVQV